jgi:hypothetical protein
VPGKEAADRPKQHEIGPMVSRGPARLRALSPQDTVSAAGHPIPPGAHREKPRRHASRARRKRAASGEDEHAICTRHRWQVEGAHGTAKTLRGRARAIRRGLENMKIQALLTATAMNPKKLAAALMLPACPIVENHPARPAQASL